MPTNVPSYFAFERSWLARGMRAIEQNPGLFLRNHSLDAQHELGLGSQQVLALEYWLRTLQCITPSSMGYSLTSQGKILRLYDPQVEDSSTWLTLHYRLASEKDRSFCYWVAFNVMPKEFTRNELIAALASLYPGKSNSTYFNHTRWFFSFARNSMNGNELGILSVSDERITVGRLNIDRVPHLALAFCICEYARINMRKTLGIPELVQSDGVGRQLCLSEDFLSLLLQQIGDKYCGRIMSLSTTAGLNSVAFSEEFTSRPLALLRACYLERMEGMEPLDALTEGLRLELASEEEVSQ